MRISRPITLSFLIETHESSDLPIQIPRYWNKTHSWQSLLDVLRYT